MENDDSSKSNELSGSEFYRRWLDGEYQKVVRHEVTKRFKKLKEVKTREPKDD